MTREEIIKAIEEMSVLELSQLVKDLEEIDIACLEAALAAKLAPCTALPGRAANRWPGRTARLSSARPVITGSAAPVSPRSLSLLSCWTMVSLERSLRAFIGGDDGGPQAQKRRGAADPGHAHPLASRSARTLTRTPPADAGTATARARVSRVGRSCPRRPS